MGLRTTNRSPLLPITKQTLCNTDQPSTSSAALTASANGLLKSTLFLHPDAANSGKMAPALTEPLSPTNKLSSSAASASPRPTAVGSPLQTNTNTNNNNNNNINQTNNNNDNIDSVIDENSSIQTNSNLNSTSGGGGNNKDKILEAKPFPVAAAPSIQVTVPQQLSTVAPSLSSSSSSKGAFQLAFEQSVGVQRKQATSTSTTSSSSSSSTVVNGEDTLSSLPNSSQMGPMCDSKSSPSSLIGPNSSPLIKSKITQIDAETAAKIITSQFEDFPSDIEEAITAEICLRQKLKSTEEQEEQSATKPELNILSDSKTSMEVHEEINKTDDKTLQNKQIISEGETSNKVSEVNSEKLNSKSEEASRSSKLNINIISVQELPPIKTDSTVTASEDDNIEERLKQLESADDCPMPISQESGAVGENDLPTTSTSSSSQIISAQLTPTSNASNIITTATPTTPTLSALTPLSTTSTLCGSSGNTKDFKDNNSEMDHDIEDDLLQVLKGFDPNTTANDICDLAGFLSEYGMNYEDVNPPSTKESPMKEVHMEIEKNQQTMQRKIDFLARRLRKLQARYMSKQASEEISGLIEWSARTTKRKNSNAEHQQPMTYAEEKYHPVTTTTIRNVLKKIENVASNAQQDKSSSATTAAKKIQQSSKSAEFIPPPPPAASQLLDVVVPTYDEKVTDEIAHVSGRLQAEMREVQSALDSDATASSSGGESADEMVPYNNLSQETMPISKRAAWRYSRDRAAIASRWTWLMSQISDLEFKIRQHTELHQQLRQRKGKVVLLDKSEAATTTTTTTTGSSNANASGSGPNGYRGTLPGSTTTSSKTTDGFTADVEENELDSGTTEGACRTRAFQSNLYRKRKLFQTANVHTISKKAARPSTIKCGCQWPLYPCALCTGRSDPTAPRDLPDTMMKAQRVALLDPGFHPVLSFTEDISNSIFFEKIARNPEWQNRVARSTAKSVVRGALAAQRAAEKEEHQRGGGSYATSGRITQSTPNTSSTSNNGPHATSSGKRKYTKRNHQDGGGGGVGGGGGSHSTTPLVANKVGKGKKKKRNHQQKRNQSPDYIAFPRKTTITTTTVTNHSDHQTLHQQQQQTQQQPQSHHRNVEQSNHLQAHSSLNCQNSKNNKIRKLSSASQAAATTITTTNTFNNYNSSNNTCYQQKQQYLNQHQSYNSELNFLHCDSLDGDSSTNGLMTGPPGVGRSRTSSPTHTSNHHKHERSLERRSRTSYDIDNIVIPYSVAAATRVEVLPYKEIPTPKWRIIDDDAEEENALKSINNSEVSCSKKSSTCEETDGRQNNTDKLLDNGGKGDEQEHEEEEEEEEEEDISDEAMILRHERALAEERRKFQTFLKFPYSTRSRANRRIDSRAESSGANTPDPTSPAPNTPSVGGDQESIPSPFAPSTPLTPLESISETGEPSSNPSALDNTPSIMNLLNSISRKQERRRTVSTKKEKDEHRRSSTPDPRDLIPPYEPLKFPLSDDLYESMLRMMPNEYPPPSQEDCPKSTKKPSSTTTTAATAATNGFGKNTYNPNQFMPSSSASAGVAQKNVCDQNVTNNKHTSLTLNQKVIHHHHITGEDELNNDDDDDEADNDDGEEEEEEEEEEAANGDDMDEDDYDHFYPRDPVIKSSDNSINNQIKPSLPSSKLQEQGNEGFRDELQQSSSFLCRNNLLGCSDTESLESENDVDDDPNDPEWKEEQKHK